MQVMRDHLKNSFSVLIQSSFGTHQMTYGTHPLPDHHQKEQHPLPRLGMDLLLKVVETEW